MQYCVGLITYEAQLLLQVQRHGAGCDRVLNNKGRSFEIEVWWHVFRRSEEAAKLTRRLVHFGPRE